MGVSTEYLPPASQGAGDRGAKQQLRYARKEENACSREKWRQEDLDVNGTVWA
jgi:hypothetical protein